MTPEQMDLGSRLGQEIVDLITKRMDAEKDNDLNLVFSVVVSVAAHFIAGIRDEDSCKAAFREFGVILAVATAEARETGNHANVERPRPQ